MIIDFKNKLFSKMIIFRENNYILKRNNIKIKNDFFII